MNVGQSEMAVLASVVEHGITDECPNIARMIREASDSFEHGPHIQIALAIQQIHADGKPVNLLSVPKLLEHRKQDAALLVFHSADFTANALPIGLAEYEAGGLLESYVTRQAQAVLEDAAKAFVSSPAKARAIADGVTASFSHLFQQPKAILKSRSIGDIEPRTGQDPDELIKDRFLCRGGSLLLAAPTGVGKSTFAMQAAVCWSIGQNCLGVRPARPLRTLLIQAENDDGDLAELRDGNLNGLKISAADRARVFENFHFETVDSLAGPCFISGAVEPLCKDFKPDLVIIDPLLSYLGGDVSRQDVVSPFLRNHLNPVLHRTGAACLLVHHTNKPASGKEKPDWKAGELAYLGSGSAELANWARAVIGIRSVGEHGVFEMVLAKRGGRVGWVNDDGTKCYSKHIAHGTDGIYWRDAEEDELPMKAGRKTEHTAAEIVDILGADKLTSSDWQDLCKSERGISPASFYRLLKDVRSQRLASQSSLDRKWFRNK